MEYAALQGYTLPAFVSLFGLFLFVILDDPLSVHHMAQTVITLVLILASS
jgi:hypothetical protein